MLLRVVHELGLHLSIAPDGAVNGFQYAHQTALQPPIGLQRALQLADGVLPLQ